LKFPPLKPGVSPLFVWLTAAGGLLLTALSILPLLDVAWGAGAVIVLTILYKFVEAKKQQAAPPANTPPETTSEDHDTPSL